MPDLLCIKYIESGKRDKLHYKDGSESTLGPMAYCLAGIASCFTATFVSVAALNKIIKTESQYRMYC